MTNSTTDPLLPLPNGDAFASQKDQATDKTISKISGKNTDLAVQKIREKINQLYSQEPSAKEEIKEIEAVGAHSRHQQFLYELHNQGLSQTEINKRWHDYYLGLNNHDKHQVWQEFYLNSNRSQANSLSSDSYQHAEQSIHEPRSNLVQASTLAKLKHSLRRPKISHDSSLRFYLRRLKDQFRSAVFGLTVGLVFLSLYMFTFFNERFVIPFVQPSSVAASTPIIVSPDTIVSSDPKVIIPKLNVEAPVVYTVPFIQPGESAADFEDRIQTGLESGVVHYPTSQLPGQTGDGFNSNVVIVGHSSNNIFNRGAFKFAFMQLRNLESGDTFMLNYQEKQYVYRVYDKKVVPPTEISVLGPAERPNSATLITCDPPGLNTNRLVVFAEQISPDPSSNRSATEPVLNPANVDAGIVPGNAESLWSRINPFN